MKGKLIKTDDEYRLYLDDILPYATSDNSPYKRLSKQNCDEIFGVVDVDVFIDELLVNRGEHISRVRNKIYGEERDLGIECFNKAMELNKDKLFTEADMIKFADDVYKLRKENKIFEEMPKLLQSLQQPTEIEVEIVMGIEFEQVDRINNDGTLHESHIRKTGEERPMLDKDGCLILRKL
jgi:hypothetical protein